jgi:ring-1,2-phenylacetyl-CoA epoxidase subunit PaaE
VSKFYPIQVSNIEQSTSDCRIITLNVPQELHDDFAYKQGQYLTLKAYINGEEVRRSYSLCSSPIDEHWQIGVKKIPNGKFSTYANDILKVGDTIDVMAPQGNFYIDVSPSTEKHYVAFAAGSGITPIHSIIATHLEAESNSTFTLFYINQSTQSIILKEAIEALKNQYLGRFRVFHFLTREKRTAELFNGRIDSDKLEVLFSTICSTERINDYFLCGPEAMIHLVKDYLVDNGVNESNVHFELFGTNTDMTKERQETIAQEFAGKTCDLTVKEGGKSFSIAVPQGESNVLDIALAQHADLPFACKGGVCATCKCKLEEGEVEMLVSYGLEQDEIDNGYILSCQAVPLSEKIIVDFDI